MMNEKQQASEAARILSKLGASKGGHARAEKLTPERRSEIGRRAAQARWSAKSGGMTRKCPICGEPYKFYAYSAADQSACPPCVRKAERNR